MTYFETERLIVRDWKPTDTSTFIAMNQNSKIMQYFPYILNTKDSLLFLDKIEQHFKKYGYGLFALERKDTNEFIGYTGFWHPSFEAHFTPCIEIGWRLNNTVWNKGFATEAATACLDYAFNKIKLTEIFSFTSIHNKPSERVMQKIGMQFIDTFNHPSIPTNHFLQKHILYKIST
ncbi:MAG: GNAT family N-acetyltransferase [Bacteroidetes bacterium]|nr:GNAT family N-acetyltransferase [Bacteroidota bacterium]MBS1648737.1 GNAT family N-acetyltransferase [Bacteroidota bacterium]